MNSLINIKQLAIDTTIGVYDFEKTIKQRLLISVTLRYNISQAMKSDELADTFDYAQLSQHLIETLENNHYQLIERVVDEIEQILTQHFQLTHYKIEIEKPSALKKADGVSVILDKL